MANDTVIRRGSSSGNRTGAPNGMRPLGTGFVPIPIQVIETPEGKLWVLDRLDSAIARNMLEKKHPGQRKVNMRHVASIARAMEKGDYRWTGEPVKLDRKGQLIDGQHRLSAVVQADAVIQNVVIAEINDNEVYKYLDTVVRTRSQNDIRTFLGQRPIPNQVVAAIVYEHCDFKLQARKALTKPETNDIVEKFEFIEDVLDLYRSGGTKMRVNAGTLAGAVRCIRANRDAAMQFFTAAFNNDHKIGDRDEPMVKLFSDWLARYALIRSGHAAGKTARNHEDQIMEGAEKAVRAYNAWRMREPIVKLQRTGEVPTPLK